MATKQLRAAQRARSKTGARNEPEIGQRILATRHDRGLSQGMVARRAGVDPSYLSRIERGNVQPTVRTAARIAAALRMSLSDLLKPLPATKSGQPCPVTAGGRCLLDLLDTGQRGPDGHEHYTPRELRLLRQFTTLIREGSPQAVKGMELLIGQILAGANGD